MKIELPNFKLDIQNKQEVIDLAGTFIRDSIVQRVRSGLDAQGNALHPPKDGGQPLVRTGQLLASIQWRPSKSGTSGTVAPRGPRQREKGQGRQPNNTGLAAILAVEDKRAHGTRPPMPIMGVTAAEDHELSRRVSDTLKADLTSDGITEIG
jgi:hypothetical protein